MVVTENLSTKIKDFARAFEKLGPDMAKRVFAKMAEITSASIQSTLSSGQSPAGRPWAPKADGQPVKPWAEEALSKSQQADAMTRRLDRPYAIFHERGASKKAITEGKRKALARRGITLRTRGGGSATWKLPKRQALFCKKFPVKIARQLNDAMLLIVGRCVREVLQ
jgi:hypothetical protein